MLWAYPPLYKLAPAGVQECRRGRWSHTRSLTGKRLNGGGRVPWRRRRGCWATPPPGCRAPSPLCCRPAPVQPTWCTQGQVGPDVAGAWQAPGRGGWDSRAGGGGVPDDSGQSYQLPCTMPIRDGCIHAAACCMLHAVSFSLLQHCWTPSDCQQPYLIKFPGRAAVILSKVQAAQSIPAPQTHGRSHISPSPPSDRCPPAAALQHNNQDIAVPYSMERSRTGARADKRPC